MSGSVSIAAERRFGLDVLRAVAITGVVYAHFHAMLPDLLPSVKSGYFGVELFFVLSGFLIGGLLLDIAERDPGWRDWLTFMVRRWLRTVPVYLTWTIVLALTFPPAEGWTVVLRTLTFTQNFAWTMPVDNWFGVSWSLTVEEWFYFLFSVVFLALAVYRPRHAMTAALVLFLFLPLVVRVAAADAGGNWDTTVRKVVVARLDAIAYGVLAVALWRKYPALLHRWRYPLLIVGAVTALGASFTIPPQGALRWLIFSLTSAGFALTVPAMVALRRPRTMIAPVVEWVSTRSYGIYIVHLSLLLEGSSLLRSLGIAPPWADVAALALTLAIADLSWRYFEQPILRTRPRQFAPGRGEPIPPLPAFPAAPATVRRSPA